MSPKILIVEDDPMSEFYLRKITDCISNEVISVQNGFDAITKCKEERFDIILMDIQMPGIDGFVTTEKIRKRDKDTIIIAQTANTGIYERERAFQCGCNDFISKPYYKDELIALINKHLNMLV